MALYLFACSCRGDLMPDENDQKQVENTISFLEENLRMGNFLVVDDWLSSIDISSLNSASIVGALSITFWGKDKLSKRDYFLARAEEQLNKNLGSKRAFKLLENRR